MKNKEFDTVKMVRSIREKNYKDTKDMTRRELLERYKKRGRAAKKQFNKSSNDSKLSR